MQANVRGSRPPARCRLHAAARLPALLLAALLAVATLGNAALAQQPDVTSVAPAAGSTAGGTSVVLTGTDFTGATAVDFGAAPATGFTVDSNTQITATSPAGSAGAINITVTTPGGTSATGAGNQFTYVTPPSAPTLTAPANASFTNDSTPTISGTADPSVTVNVIVDSVTVGTTTSTGGGAWSYTSAALADGGHTVAASATVSGVTGPSSAARSFTVDTAAPAAPVITAPTNGANVSLSPTIGGTAEANSSVTVVIDNVDAGTVTANGGGAWSYGASLSVGPYSIKARAADAAGNTSPDSTTIGVTARPPPTVSNLSLNAGPSAGGQAVTITGFDFFTITGVTIGGVTPTSVSPVNSTTIDIVTPAGTGTVNVVVTTVGGTSATSSANEYTYLDPPTVTSLAPSAGPTAGGATVVLTGTNFSSVSAVSFGATPASGFTVDSATQITATSPAGSAGTVNVRVTTPGGQSATGAGNQYTYASAPTVTSLSVGEGPTGGGTSVVLTGTNFSGASAVSFGGTAASGFTVDSATQITATAPAGGAGTVNVRVTTAGGQSATGAGNQFTYVAAPAVTSLSVNEGPTGGGTSVVLTGTNLTGATAVSFGGAAASGFTVDSATQITATAPAGGAGTVNVRVTTVGGQSATGVGNQFTYVAAPTVTSLSVSEGPTGGGTTVVLAGTGFAGASAVSFGGTAASGFTVDSATQITATAPAGSAGAVNVRVTTVGGQSATGAGNQYTYVAAPTVTSLSVNEGPTGGGTSVVLTGTGFTGATAVAFGATAASGFTVDSATQITATAPAGSAGTVNVRVTTVGGQSATAAGNQFTYVAAPTVTLVSPSAGPLAGGNAVTITGTGFSGASAVAFGATAASGFTVNSATQITATAPAGSAGVVDVRVTTVGGQSATGAGDQYTYAPIPAVTALAPSSGPTAGGSSVTITGAGFAGATAVSFGGAAASGFTVDSATQITATSPAASAGAAQVTVSTSGGTSATGSASQFTFIAPLVVTPGAASGTKVAVAYAQANPASGGVAPYSYALASGALPAGTTLNAATGAVTGTPTTAGAFSYAIAATDSQGAPATATGATVSGTIAKGDQTVGFTSTTPTDATVLGPSYTPTATATSGLTAVFSVGGGGACTISSGVVSFVAVGSCVVYADQAGDANWNAATQVQQTIAVDPQLVPTVADASAAVAYNTAATIDLSGSIAGAHTSIAVSVAPARGSTSVSGDVVTYTPATDYIGADSFSYTATGPGGVSAPAVVSLTVAPPPPPVANAAAVPVASSMVQGGGQNPINLSALATGEVTDIQIVTPPSHGTAVVTTSLGPSSLRPQSVSPQAVGDFIAIYTPSAGYVGTDSFQFVAVGPGGTSPPATVTLSVTGTAPTAAALAATTIAGRPVDVTLTQGATEGPFTAAAVVLIAPASAGEASIREATAGVFVLTFTPDDAFGGSVQIDYTLSNAFGVSAPAALTVTVESRPDPTSDPDVRGLADAQGEAVRRFGWTQLGNFTRRLEAVRGSRTPGAGGLTFASGVFDRTQRYAGDGLLSEALADDEAWARAFEPALFGDGALPPSATTADPAGDMTKVGVSPTAPGALRFWSGGAITVGRREGGAGTAELDIVSGGISAGADLEVSAGLVLGAGLGLGRDVTDVGDAGSRSEALNLTGAAYFSAAPTEATFIDGVVGGGGLDFDLRRFSSEAAAFAAGDRDGALLFGSLGAGFQGASETHDWSAYGRLELVDAELDAYAEDGAGLYNLAYDEASLRSLSSVLGARASFASEIAGVPARPSLRLEWRHELEDDGDLTLRYADWLAGSSYLIRSEGFARDRISAGAGLSLLFERGWTLDLEGAAELGDSTQAGTVSGAISKRF